MKLDPESSEFSGDICHDGAHQSSTGRSARDRTLSQ
jgi:hypothetical protein